MEYTKEQLETLVKEAMIQGAEMAVYYYTDDKSEARRKIAERLVNEGIERSKR